MDVNNNRLLAFKGAPVSKVNKSDLIQLFTDFFDLVLYNHPCKTKTSRKRKIYAYKNNETFWLQALKGAHYEEMSIHLEKFHLTEWMPYSPGRYFTEKAIQSRAEANRFFDFEKAEYKPLGKARMILGGVGSVRLGSKKVEDTKTYFLGATSTEAVHEGIPVAVDEEQYRTLIEPIKKTGGCITSLTGSLKLLPTDLSIFQYPRDMPKYCLFAEDFEIIKPSPENHLLANAAILFPSRYLEYEDPQKTELKMDGYTTNMMKMWSFCSFNPGSKNSLKQAVDWLRDYASRHSGIESPPILNDFDECYQHFENPIEFTIKGLFDNTLSIERINAYKSLTGITINIGELHTGDIFSNNNYSTIINRSRVEKSFNEVQKKYDKDTAMALLQIAKEIEKTGNKEAAELFDCFNEELQKPDSKKSLLKSTWEGIQKALPSILQITDIAVRISKIISSSP